MTEETTPRATFRELDSAVKPSHSQGPRARARFSLPEPAASSSSMSKVRTAPPTPELPSSFLGHRKHGSTSMLRSTPTRASRVESLLALPSAARHEREESSLSLVDMEPGGLSAFQMAALVEIQRVLYHGGRGLARKGKDKASGYTLDEVAEITERYLDPDCTYESPFVSLPKRSLVCQFFHLSTILSQILLPSLTPWGIFHHLKSAASLTRDDDQDLGAEHPAWWRAWDIWGDCAEIGGMECFDDHHVGLIDQTLNIHLLPHLLPPALQTIPDSPEFDPSSTFAKVPASSQSLFSTSLSHTLRFEVRIVTVVEFNESGKISYMRDLIDLREVIESIVPFGKAIGWIARRVSGLAAAGLCVVIETLRPKPSVTTSHWPPKNDEEWAGWQARMSEAMDSRQPEDGGDLSRTSSSETDGGIKIDLGKSKSKMSRENTLGLSSDECAPDVDSAAS